MADEDVPPPGDHEDGEEAGDGRDLAPSAADPKAVREQRRRKDLADKERIRFWQGVLADPVGRRELWQLIGVEAHAFEQRFGCSPNGFPDQQATWFHLGEQMLGQRVYDSLCIIDPEGSFLMRGENDPRFPKPKRKQR